MNYFPAALQELADQFARLPGIGGKTAQRLAFHVLSLSQADVQAFADAIVSAKREVHTCPCCQNLTDRELCPICSDDNRDAGVICVVADPKDVIAMERSREVIMATNPDTEGEATAMYISRLLRPMEVKVTRLAYGVPVGSQLEYADEVTLSRALEGRQEI